MKRINLKSISEPLSNEEMKLITGGLRCWCCGSDEIFDATSEEEVAKICDDCFGCFSGRFLQ